MGDWQHSSLSVGWVKDFTDRRYYFGVIGGGFASAFVGGGYFLAVVDDFGNLVRVRF